MPALTELDLYFACYLSNNIYVVPENRNIYISERAKDTGQGSNVECQ